MQFHSNLLNTKLITTLKRFIVQTPSFKGLMDHLHWQCLLAKESATLDCTCIGHLGRRDTDRIISIYVVMPKVAKASIRVTVACHCRQHYRLKYIANVHEPLLTSEANVVNDYCSNSWQ